MTFLDRLFKPKWQHTNAEIRKQALDSLSINDPLLSKLARDDPDPGLRRSALARISDLQVLQDIAANDAEVAVRDVAQARLRNLLTGKDELSPSLAQRLATLQQDNLATAIDEFLVSNAAEPELRLAALAKLKSLTAAQYADIVINDPALPVRSEALSRIDDLATLAKVAKRLRNRDKRLYRTAREKVERLQAEQRHQEEIEQLCLGMENLQWDGETGPNAARFARLDRQWQQLQATIDDESIKQRFQQARTRYTTLLEENINKRTARQALCDDLLKAGEQLGIDIEEKQHNRSQSVQEQVQQAQQAWQALGDIASHDIEGLRQQRQFEQLCEDLLTQEQTLRSNQRQLRQRHSALRAAEKLVQQPGQVLEADVHALRQRWQRLPRPDAPELLSRLQQRFETITAQLQDRLQRQAEQKGRELAELDTLVEQLEQVLDAGELQQAIDLGQQTREKLRTNISLSQHQMAALEERLQSCAGTITRLRSWRRWGTNQARENLCAEAEQLLKAKSEDVVPATDEQQESTSAALSTDPVALARQVRELRAAWKALDSAEGAAPRALWKRFNDACEQAYVPAQEYFDERAQQRQANLSQRQALCERIEQFNQNTDWESAVDWREVSRFESSVQSQWRKLGPVNRAERKAIDKRYKVALQTLQERLKPQLEQDIQRRQALIDNVKALAEHEDLNVAINGAKQAQTEWQPQVLASRRREQAMWKAFRAACDAVFARRQAEREAQDVERKENLNRKAALCEELEQLAGLAGDELLQADRQVQALQQTWEAMGPLPRNEARALEQRFNKALSKFQKNYQLQQRSQACAALYHSLERALFCQKAEVLLLADNVADDAVATLQTEWQQLPVLDEQLLTPIQQRFEAVCQALTAGSEQINQLAEQLRANYSQRRELCLQLEIASGTETPAAYAQERMEYQVARLSQSMAERNTGQSESENQNWHTLIVQLQPWFASGSLPIEQEEELQVRFRCVLNTLCPERT